MTLEEPPEARPPARTLGWVWLVVGGLAVVVGAVSTIVMIVVFGLVAAALGGVLLVVANVRDKSRARTARTLSGDPPPPATAPYRPPPMPAPGPAAGDGLDNGTDDSGSSGDEAGTAERDVPESRRAASEAEDGTGVAEDDRRE